MRSNGWRLGLGLVVITAGCADPCEDDGLVQSGQGECPAAIGIGGSSGGSSDDGSVSASASDSDAASDTANSDSDSNSGTDSETASASASATESDSGSDTDTDSDSATDTDSGSDTDSSSDSGSDTDSDSDSDTSGATTPYCTDADEDGFGDPDSCVDVPEGEDPPDGSVPNDDDCNDDSASTFPGAAQNDDEDACMQDEDDDGWGDDDPPEGVTPGTDCDDEDVATFPGAAELDSDTECMQDEDDDGWGDDAPDEGVTPGSDCSDDGVDPCVVLITQDGTDANTYDQGLIGVLQSNGFEILNFADTDVVLEDGNGVDIVVISETAQSSDVAGVMRDTLAPVVCLEGLVWDDMGMAPQASTTGIDNVQVLDPASPLAAGLSGTQIAIAGTGAGLFYVPAPAGAQIIAAVANDADDIVEFAFESGDVMLDDFEAPNRRVGLGYDADQSGNPSVTIEAAGLALFEAAVLWATGA